jgi:hypothetical protein
MPDDEKTIQGAIKPDSEEKKGLYQRAFGQPSSRQTSAGR